MRKRTGNDFCAAGADPGRSSGNPPMLFRSLECDNIIFCGIIILVFVLFFGNFLTAPAKLIFEVPAQNVSYFQIQARYL